MTRGTNTPWIRSVRESGQLSVYKGGSLIGDWSAAFDRAMDDLNALCRQQNLGVQLVQTTEPADPSGMGGANVQVEVGLSFSISGLGPSLTASVENGRAHGSTAKYAVPQSGASDLAIVRALVLCPPSVSPEGRGGGVGVKLVVMAHELVHALGVGIHSPYEQNDLMNSSFEPELGGDRLHTVNYTGRRFMPPIGISGPTAQAIRGLWG